MAKRLNVKRKDDTEADVWQGENIAFNFQIAEIKLKTNMALSLGIWYVQIPYGFIINPQGEVVEPKQHNGSVFIWKNRQRFPVSKLPHLNYQAANEFKTIFYE